MARNATDAGCFLIIRHTSRDVIYITGDFWVIDLEGFDSARWPCCETTEMRIMAKQTKAAARTLKRGDRRKHRARGRSMAVVGMAANPLVPTRPAATGPAEQWKRARHSDSAGHAFRRARIGPSPP